MKKFLLIALCATLYLGAHSQTGILVTMPTPNGSAARLDTAINATAEGAVMQVPGPAKTLSITTVVTKISGTIAGFINWQASNDGVNYSTLSTSALTDVAVNTYNYKEVDKAFQYYRAQIAMSGTATVSYQSTLYTTKLQVQ